MISVLALQMLLLKEMGGQNLPVKIMTCPWSWHQVEKSFWNKKLSIKKMLKWGERPPPPIILLFSIATNCLDKLKNTFWMGKKVLTTILLFFFLGF